MIADIDATEGPEGAARDSQTPVTPRTEKSPASCYLFPRSDLISLFRAKKLFLNTEGIYIGYPAEISCFREAPNRGIDSHGQKNRIQRLFTLDHRNCLVSDCRMDLL
jgi:hypothetical protein